MADREHCAEHEARSMCIAGLKKEVEAIQAARSSALANMGNEIEKVWDAISSKLSTSAFRWTIGILILVFSGVVAAQWNLLLTINGKVTQIAETQAHLAGKLEGQGVMKR